jgi:hypothetical protein
MERVLKENELLINEWAPIHLAKVLKDWFWKDGVPEVKAVTVWQQSCQQLYLPRLKDDTVFQNTMAMGAASQDFFGLAQGKEADDGKVRYLGFSLGQRTSPLLDASLLLIEPVAAAAFAERLRLAQEAARPQPVGLDGHGGGNGGRPIAGGGVVPTPHRPTGSAPTPQAAKTQFYGNIELDPFQAKKQFVDLVDEVMMQFTSRPGVKVKIAIEIQADSPTGFDDGLQRAVKENCTVLRFRNAEFENPQG